MLDDELLLTDLQLPQQGDVPTDTYAGIVNYLGQAETFSERVTRINQLRQLISHMSPFNDQPVDFIEWVRIESIYANDYNPNAVAPPEMELLRLSIDADGYTQPIVTMPDNQTHEVIDGFHRHRVGRECREINTRLHDYLPIVHIRTERHDRGDRIAATIRHNRARGKHRTDAMSDIVIELKRRNWSNERIGRELGMEPDEVLRLCQITGLAELFTDEEFSASWDIADDYDDDFQFNETETD